MSKPYSSQQYTLFSLSTPACTRFVVLEFETNTLKTFINLMIILDYSLIVGKIPTFYVTIHPLYGVEITYPLLKKYFTKMHGG